MQSYGTTLTLQQPTYSAFSPTLGRYVSNATVSHEVTGLIRATDRIWTGDTYWGADVVVEAGDREIVLATKDGVVPDVGDGLIVVGVPYKIVACNVIQPGGTTLLYKLLLRK